MLLLVAAAARATPLPAGEAGALLPSDRDVRLLNEYGDDMPNRCHRTNDYRRGITTDATKPKGKVAVVLRGEAFRSGVMLKGVSERQADLSHTVKAERQTAASPEEQLRAFDSVDKLLSELVNQSWTPMLFVDAVVKPLEQRELLRLRAGRMMKLLEPHVAITDRMRMTNEVLNGSSPATGQMLGWASTLEWLDGVAPPEADLLVLRIDLILKRHLTGLGLSKRPSCLVFPFSGKLFNATDRYTRYTCYTRCMRYTRYNPFAGKLFNATDAFVFVPSEERTVFRQLLREEAAFEDAGDEMGLHCLLGRYPGAAPLVPDEYDANSEEGRNPLYRIAGRCHTPSPHDVARSARSIRGQSSGSIAPLTMHRTPHDASHPSRSMQPASRPVLPGSV